MLRERGRNFKRAQQATIRGSHSGEFDFKIGLGASFRLAFITSSAQIGSAVSRFADRRKLQRHKNYNFCHNILP